MHKLMELNYTEWHKMEWTQWMYYRLDVCTPKIHWFVASISNGVDNWLYLQDK